MAIDSTRVQIWDGWRGLAILLVLIGHFTYSKWIWEERMGVDVFFALSGMLMSDILFNKKIGLKDFYIRRFSRVMPALFACLCCTFSFAYAMSIDFQIAEFFSSLLFLRAYYPTDPFIASTLVPVGHLWSLNVEEHSYLIMSLLTLIALSRRHIAFVFFGIYAVSVAICFHNYFVLSAEDFRLSLFRTETTIGFIMFSAGYYLVKQTYNFNLGRYASGICLVGAALTYLDVAPIWLTFLFSPILLGIAINHLTESAKGLEPFLLSWAMRKLGIISFSVYLAQQVFYTFSQMLPGGALTGFVVSILVGAVSFYFFENPVRRCINERWSPNPRYRT